jgi:hypothetical protein
MQSNLKNKEKQEKNRFAGPINGGIARKGKWP